MLTPFHKMRLLVWAVLGVAVMTNVGCITFTRHAIPAHRLPDQFQAPSRSCLEPINFAMLAQSQPEDYLLGAGDLLAVSVSGIIPPNTTELPPPITMTTLNREYYPPGGGLNAPGFGLPLEVQVDGTITMPLIAPVEVAGKTLTEAAEEIRKAYRDKDVVKEGKDQTYITLLRSRVNRIMVLREDAVTPTSAMVIRKGEALLHKRGTGQVVDLPIYESDVLHALTASGGLPGIDANNEVWILRKTVLQPGDSEKVQEKVEEGKESAEEIIKSVPAHLQATRIPLKLCCGEPVPFSPQDVVLNDGDILYIEPRRQEYFYTGGLLQGGQIPIPRDEDLDILEAVALANGAVGGVSGSSAAAVLRAGAGVGNILPPSRVLILRKLPNGGQLPIRVNLSHAMRDPSERIRIMPGDYVMMYYTPGEQVGNAVLNLFNFNILVN